MRALLFCLLAPAVIVAQENPFSRFNIRANAQMKAWVVKSAEKMPVEHFNFKPTPDVRSFGEILGHIAGAQYEMCSAAMGEKNPVPEGDIKKASREEMIDAVKASFTYCDKAYAAMTDAAAAEKVKLWGSEIPKPVVLSINSMHTSEHYGNLVTYLRLKNIVPPSSERAAAPPPPQKK